MSDICIITQFVTLLNLELKIIISNFVHIVTHVNDIEIFPVCLQIAYSSTIQNNLFSTLNFHIYIRKAHKAHTPYSQILIK